MYFYSSLCFINPFTGPEPGVFKSKHYCLRLHYSVYGQSGYFHMFRSTNTRFFNNMAVPICSEEEAAGDYILIYTICAQKQIVCFIDINLFLLHKFGSIIIAFLIMLKLIFFIMF